VVSSDVLMVQATTSDGARALLVESSIGAAALWGSASIRFSDKTCAVEERPVTRYVTAPDGVSPAYQVIGGGALDLVFFRGLALPIDLLWEDPGFAHFARRLGRFSRTVWLEGRGIGASGGDFTASAVDENVHGQMVYGLTSVVDAIGCEQVVLVAHGSAGPVAIRYAVTHSERVKTLVLVDSHAYYVREDGFPWGMPPDAINRHIAVVKEA
jgi:pimeloyl-ACP methyl ester carboxylesterase